jgi:hypothetical protein
MNQERIEKIAAAVLYEGYMLYPYRASAIKNQQRWNFGVLCPRSYSELQRNSEAWSMQTECLLEGPPSAQLKVKIRFLQVVNRSVGKLIRPIDQLEINAEPAFDLVDRLKAGDQTFAPWQEAVEREVALPPLQTTPASHPPTLFEFPAGRELEALRGDDGLIAGVLIREWETLSGSVAIHLAQPTKGVLKVTVRIENLTPYEPSHQTSRADAVMYSLVSTHTTLMLEGAQFLSLIDPPETLKPIAEECRNLGTWPVLVGDEGDRDAMLSSPIILYDYPQIAPESPGSLFDGTEIDEILSLRILTLTDAEKSEMRQSDQFARAVLERTESIPPEHFMKMHGVMRNGRTLSKEAL